MVSRKKCPHCTKTKDRRGFYTDRKRASSLSSWCKKCTVDGSIEWRDSNRVRFRKQARDRGNRKRREAGTPVLATPRSGSHEKCTSCDKFLLNAAFYTGRNGKIEGHCRECIRISHRRWKQENPEAVLTQKKRAYAKSRSNPRRLALLAKSRRRRRLKQKYGMTIEQFDEMKKEQGGSCAICFLKPKKLCVDHDHQTGAVRGLLCNRCNTSLGTWEHEPGLLQRVSDYLRGNHYPIFHPLNRPSI